MVTQKFTEITEILASFLCAARAEGTFCDFRDFCVKIYNPLFREIDAVVINDELHGTAAKFPGIGRDTQFREFFTMGRQIPCEGPRRYSGQPGQL